MSSSNPPTLLNDDGRASIATTLMMSHHGLRRDIARFAIALRELMNGERSEILALKEEWTNYHNTLHGHHQAEDQGIFPSVLAQEASLAPVIDGLMAEHRRIDPLLLQGDRAFGDLPKSAMAAADVVSQISTLLDGHLATEEARVIPILRNAKEFPAPASEDETDIYAQGFAWSSYGIAPEVLERVNDMLPEALKSKLPAARAAFAERYQRVWGRTESGTSRTPIPDWLSS